MKIIIIARASVWKQIAKFTVSAKMASKGDSDFCTCSKEVTPQKLIEKASSKYIKNESGDTLDGDCLIEVLSVTEPVMAKITVKHRPPDRGPIGRITKNQEMDLIGGKFLYTCHCGRSNGLNYDCRRVACQNNPGCKMTPPQCWPKYKPPPEKVTEIESPVRLCYVNEKAKKNVEPKKPTPSRFY